MNRKILIPLILGAFLVPFFCDVAAAETINKQNTNETFTLNADQYSPAAFGGEGVSSMFANDTNFTASQIKIHINQDLAATCKGTTPKNDYWRFRVEEWNDCSNTYSGFVRDMTQTASTTYTGGDWSSSGIFITDTGTPTKTYPAGYYVINLANTDFHSGKCYRFEWVKMSDSNQNVCRGLNTIGIGNIPWYSLAGTNTIYYQVGSNLGSGSLSFYNPQNGQTKTADFSSWVVNATALPEYTGDDYYRIEVDHGASTTPAFADVYYTHGGDGQFSFGKSRAFTFLDNGAWYAAATLQDKNDNIIAAAPQMSFNLNIGNPNSVEFYTPTNGATTTVDFPSWVVNATTTPEYTGDDYYRIAVGYEKDNNGTLYIDDYYTHGGAGQFAFAKTRPLTDGSWNATVSIYDKDSNLIASNEINWTVIIGGGSGKPVASCEGGNWVGNKFCEVMQYLFIPDDGSLNQFRTLWDILADKVPFGWFSAVRGAILGINTTGDPAYTIDFLSVQGFLDDFCSPLRNGLTAVFWLMFAFWFIRRIGKFNFK